MFFKQAAKPSTIVQIPSTDPCCLISVFELGLAFERGLVPDIEDLIDNCFN